MKRSNNQIARDGIRALTAGRHVTFTFEALATHTGMDRAALLDALTELVYQGYIRPINYSLTGRPI